MKSPGSFLTDLEMVVNEKNFEAVGPLLEEIDPTTFSPTEITTTLATLRRKRLFAELEKACTLFVFADNEQPVIKRHWCQSLLDQNRTGQALKILEATRPAVIDDAVEGPEIRGLIGRAYKQAFVDDGDADDLRSAIAAYREDWQRDCANRWHGINLVALLERARRDGISTAFTDDPAAVARTIHDDLARRQEYDAWDLATAMEASIALHDVDRALSWAREYVSRPDADAFELGSTLRQLKEVWQLETTDLGRTLIPVLEAELLERTGGSISLSAQAPNDDGFQAIYGSEGYVRFRWLDTLYRRCRAVGRIFNHATGDPCGTGFVVRGGDLVEEWGERPVLMTNSHVLSDDPEHGAPLLPGQGCVAFTRVDGEPEVQIGPVLFTSSPQQLDVTICHVDPPDGLEPLELTRYSPLLADDGPPQRIYVIGYPHGGDLVVSLYDNDLRGYEGRFVRYSSPTEHGHSGSPVLNRQWSTFAVHHRTLRTRRLNEGVLLTYVIDSLSAQFP